MIYLKHVLCCCMWQFLSKESNIQIINTISLKSRAGVLVRDHLQTQIFTMFYKTLWYFSIYTHTILWLFLLHNFCLISFFLLLNKNSFSHALLRSKHFYLHFSFTNNCYIPIIINSHNFLYTHTYFNPTVILNYEFPLVLNYHCSLM